MIRSMTGFGDATARVASGDNGGSTEYFVELRSVNNKYFKTIMRLPEDLQPLEPSLEVAIKKRLDRGTVTVRIVQSDTSASAAMEINAKALDRYVDALRASEAVASGSVSFDAAGLLSLPGVLQSPPGEDERLRRARGALMPLVEQACDRLIEMRQREGGDLERDLRSQLDLIAEHLGEISERAPAVVQGYEQRLKQRIEMLLENAGARIEQGDLVREIAIYAEKTDIAEELTRLGGHIDHFRDRLSADGGEPVGRTLDFLTQEMLREANTIASKSPDAAISERVVDIKGAIDRIKEQVQNVV
ncbi:MAG: YicC/YloC family endoribonuclease [Planctomycetota bacterium]